MCDLVLGSGDRSRTSSNDSWRLLHGPGLATGLMDRRVRALGKMIIYSWALLLYFLFRGKGLDGLGFLDVFVYFVAIAGGTLQWGRCLGLPALDTTCPLEPALTKGFSMSWDEDRQQESANDWIAERVLDFVRRRDESVLVFEVPSDAEKVPWRGDTGWSEDKLDWRVLVRPNALRQPGDLVRLRVQPASDEPDHD